MSDSYENWDADLYRKALLHQLSEHGFESDFNALMNCDVCLLVLPCGRSAHLEAGYAKGTGKKLIIYIPFYDEPELMYKMADEICITLEEVVKALS